jgi:hypothetical protein
VTFVSRPDDDRLFVAVDFATNAARQRGGSIPVGVVAIAIGVGAWLALAVTQLLLR